MKCSIILASLLAVSGSRAASTSHIKGEVVERLHGIPEGWTEVGAPHPDQKLRFRIAVRSADPELLERTLMEVSSPSHPRYGQHLKRHELKDLVKPREGSTSNIIRWLEQSGVESRDIQDNGEWINFYVPVKRAEQMMETTFKTYQSGSRTDIKRIRSLGYSVPKHVRDDIDIIQPTTRFGEIHSQHSQISGKKVVPLSKLAVNATCNDMITPDCLAELYNFKNYRPNSANVTIGVTGFLEQYAQFADWSKFVSLFAPKAAGTMFGVTRVNNGPFIQNASDPNYEANLDVQYTAGLVAPAIKTQFYSVPGRGELVPDLDAPAQSGNYNEPYLDFFTYIADLEDDELPDVLATSYGENEQSVPPAYAKKVCNLIGQIGTRGVSVIFASGDSGPGSACQSNDGKNTTRFLPIFPAACPYVTSVGGTTGISPEAAVGLSSGGFSDLWPRPAYQDKAVSAYLEKVGDRWKGFYNPQGRGFPDVAAQAQNFMIFDRGQMESIGGTSAASPAFASVIALLNNARKGAGMPSLGFLNPWIYEQGYKGLNDIVEGGSRGCTGRSKYSKLIATWVPYAGWNATEGWDPVTGHGTPDFEELLKLAIMPKSERRIRRGGLGG